MRAVPGVAGGKAFASYSGGRSALGIRECSASKRSRQRLLTHACTLRECLLDAFFGSLTLEGSFLTTEETEAQCGKAGPRLRHLWKCERGVSLLLLLAPVYNAVFPVDSLALPFISLLCPSSLWPVTTFVLLPGVQSPAQALAQNRHS